MQERESAISSGGPQEAPAPLQTVEISTGAEPTAAVVWLHGLGADGHDFEPLVPELEWPGAPPIRYVFPHAPVRPVTLNGGMAMRAWYDIVSLTGDRDADQAGIGLSMDQAAALVRRERERGIPSERIVVAGFSQGGAIALQAALRYPEKLAGLIALSTYLLLDHRLDSERSDANRDLPVFVGHGTVDPMVPIQLGEQVAARLEAMGHPVDWHRYPMPHAVCPEEVGHLVTWLRRRLG
ncbi:MAG: alpha/beta fold hydrolase [Gammaproteobacteria bacterium]|nr:alpha/beta fold hydrolase [Gammaproteobacteria bacterium]